MTTPDHSLPPRKEHLRHVRWIGGGSGAGKSTIARQLAADYGLRLYSCDATITAHARRLYPADAPLLQAFLAMTMDERWVSRTPEVMLDTFPWFAGEGLDLIIEDVCSLPPEPPILVEGFRLLPRLVAQFLGQPRQAVWLAPSSAFRVLAFERRGSTWDIPNQTSQPERALSNLLTRDQLFTRQVVTEAHALGLQVIHVDGAVDLDVMIRRIAQRLGLPAR